jgi:uncharacterized protein YbjT (DUF2867 family)
MGVLINGAYGLIGAACLLKLHLEGHELVGAGRSIAQARRRFPYAHWVVADFHELTTPESWHELLCGMDAVVNCVGALQDGARDDLRRIHVAAPAALFTACEQTGVRRVVHISAAGAGAGGSTAFARTKGEAERDLSGRNLDWVILRPGLVFANGVYGGTALVRGAAGAPFVTPVVATNPIHYVAIDDVVETVAWALRPGAPGRLNLELVHPQPMALRSIVASYRAWLGLKPQPVVTLPHLITASSGQWPMGCPGSGGAARCGRPPWPSSGRGSSGTPQGGSRRTGIVPKSLDDVLALNPATVQDRWFSRLYVLKPFAIAVLAAFWIASGIVALGPGWSAALLILRLAGFSLGGAKLAIVAGAALDIILGVAVLIRPLCRAALVTMLVVSLGYVAAAAVATPHLFADPLGSILKIFPIMLTTLFVLAILDER